MKQLEKVAAIEILNKCPFDNSTNPFTERGIDCAPETIARGGLENYDPGTEILTYSEWQEVLNETPIYDYFDIERKLDEMREYAEENELTFDEDEAEEEIREVLDKKQYDVNDYMIDAFYEQGLVAYDDTVKIIGAPSYSTGHIKGEGTFKGDAFTFDKNTVLDKMDIEWKDPDIVESWEEEYDDFYPTAAEEFVEKQLNKQLEERKKERSQNKEKSKGKAI